MTVTTPSSSSGHSDRRPSFRSTRSAIAAATRPGKPQGHRQPIPDQARVVRGGVVVRRAETGEQRAEEEHQVGQLLARVDETATAFPDEMQPERAAHQERQVRHDIEEVRDRPESAAIREGVIRQRLRHRRDQERSDRECRRVSAASARPRQSRSRRPIAAVMPRRCRRPIRCRGISFRGIAVPRLPPTAACRSRA